MSGKEEEKGTAFADPLKEWIEDLDAVTRTARKEGRAVAEPYLFGEIIPRLKGLVKLLLEEEPEEKEPQYLMIRAALVANLRGFLLEAIPYHHAAPGLFAAMESDLTGEGEDQILETIAEMRKEEIDARAEQADGADGADGAGEQG